MNDAMQLNAAQLEKDLLKRRSNLSQMSPEQKQQYAPALKALKKKILAAANDLWMSVVRKNITVPPMEAAREARTCQRLEKYLESEEWRTMGNTAWSDLLESCNVKQFVKAAERAAQKLQDILDLDNILDLDIIEKK